MGEYSVLEDSLAGLRCSATIDFPHAFSFFEVGTSATGIVFPLCNMVVHCFTGSVLAPDSTMVFMLGCAGGCEYVKARLCVGAERGTCGAR